MISDFRKGFMEKVAFTKVLEGWEDSYIKKVEWKKQSIELELYEQTIRP